jgi:DltD protein
MAVSVEGTFAARFARAAAGRPHLTAGLVATTISAVLLACGLIYARDLESRYVRDLGKVSLPMVYRSAALNAAAVRRQDTLLLYGSSELTMPEMYRATEVFRKYSNGFQVFPVGRAGTTPLIILRDLAAIGSTVRGKRVVVSVSPAWFYLESSRRDYYAGNFSPLEAYALAFSTDFSRSLRQQGPAACCSMSERSGIRCSSSRYRSSPAARGRTACSTGSSGHWASSKRSSCDCRTTGGWYG